jgi:Fe-S-cluster containining protein
MTGATPSLDHNAIPCDGCIQCCKNDQVILRPEDGDDLSLYAWEPIESALYPGRKSAALKRDPLTGYCIYLSATGCSIHDKRPAICRRYHCARTAKALEELPARTRKILKRRGDVFDDALLERGRSRSPRSSASRRCRRRSRRANGRRSSAGAFPARPSLLRARLRSP